MYKNKYGFAPDASALTQFMNLINSSPEKWTDAYKQATKKEMPLQQATPSVEVEDIPAKSAVVQYATILYGKKPTDSQVANLMAFYSMNLDDYQTDVVDGLKNNTIQSIAKTKIKVDPKIIKAYLKDKYGSVSAGAVAKFATSVSNGNSAQPSYAEIVEYVSLLNKKGSSFDSKIKTLDPVNKKLGIEFNEDDIEVRYLLSAIAKILKSKGIPSYSDKFAHIQELVRQHGAYHPASEHVAYLTNVAKLLDPTFKPPEVIKNIKPGQYYDLPVPNDELTANAKTKLPPADAEARAAELTAKINAFEAEIARLKAEQKKVSALHAKAEKEKKNLSGMDTKLVKYFSYIEKNCGEFLSHLQSTQRFLFRGQDESSSPVFVGYPRADRKPKDSSKDAQKLCDTYLKLEGFKALRSNSIFTTTDRGQASNYGRVYAIFPKDGFKFTWSPLHDDIVLHSIAELHGKIKSSKIPTDKDELFDEFNDYATEMIEYAAYGDIEDQIPKMIKKDPDAKAKVKELIKLINKWDKSASSMTFTANKIKKDFSLLAAKWLEFVALSGTKLTSSSFNKDLQQFINDIDNKADESGMSVKEKARMVIDNWGFKQDDLDSALKSGHEICVLGEFVAVNYEAYGTELQQFFNFYK